MYLDVSSVLRKAIFNVRACRANFKMAYVRVGLCTCVHSIHKSCNFVIIFNLLVGKYYAHSFFLRKSLLKDYRKYYLSSSSFADSLIMIAIVFHLGVYMVSILPHHNLSN